MKNTWSSLCFWTLFSFLVSLYAFSVFAFELKLAASPDSSYQLLTQELQKAKRSIWLNVYELSHEGITDVLINKANQGVDVKIILEGVPVGGFKKDSKSMVWKLVSNGVKDVKIMFNRSRLGRISDSDEESKEEGKASSRKFRFNHAKYAIVDQAAIVIGSENYGNHGHPSSPSLPGNRGWEIATTDKSTISYFAKLFQSDAKEDDCITPREAVFAKLFYPSNYDKSMGEVEEMWEHWQPEKMVMMHTSKIKLFEDSDCALKPISSPENSLPSLEGMIDNAKKSILIELMSFSPFWKTEGGGHRVSPLLLALERALQRGVRVWVIINDPHTFARPKGVLSGISYNDVANDNQGSYDLLMKLKKARLPLEVVIGNNQGMAITYIHNKGVIVDDKMTLVSSINWTETSISKNREAAVIITCTAAATYYQNLFWIDWNRSLQ
ncbi:MAG: hypothetical protein HQK50_15230 [Oligoflexia bacterium]|nr:hypothetical protein [Oligoflexia bacterium]MBF0366926.1 hypothetical protein [Oligoflexia bacterium]